MANSRINLKKIKSECDIYWPGVYINVIFLCLMKTTSSPSEWWGAIHFGQEADGKEQLSPGQVRAAQTYWRTFSELWFAKDGSNLQAQMFLEDISGFLEVAQSVFVCLVLGLNYWKRKRKTQDTIKCGSPIEEIVPNIKAPSCLLACSSRSFCIFAKMFSFCVSFWSISEIMSAISSCFPLINALFCFRSGKGTYCTRKRVWQHIKPFLNL